MKILFACHRLPFPPNAGGKIRSFNMIRHLSESGHSVEVASLARSDVELEEGRGLTKYCDELYIGRVGPLTALAHMVGRLPTTTPSSMGYFYSGSLHRAVRQALAERSFDLVIVHSSSAAQYVRTAEGIPAILDFCDMDSQKWLDYGSFRPFPLSLGYRLEGAKLRREEERLARRFDLSTCATEAELATLQSFDPALRGDWFPNGVDAEFFSPSEEPYDNDSICFIGRMDYYPNAQAMLWFCAQVLPLIQARRPGTRLTIVGAEPPKEIRDLARLDGVAVTGTVPDVRDYVRASALSVAPLAIARGTQNKILESMAMAVPVVCSTVASRGVDVVPGEHLLTAESPEDYADAVVGLLDDRARRDRLAAAGRERVLSSHSWEKSMQKLDDIVASVTGDRG